MLFLQPVTKGLRKRPGSCLVACANFLSNVKLRESTRTLEPVSFVTESHSLSGQKAFAS
jgi:hypothetical protein